MLPLSFKCPPGEPLRVLCLGAHCDDIEIGCGATLLRLQREHAVQFTWRIFSGNPARREETHACARALIPSPTNLDLKVLDFRDGFLPYSGAEVKEAFEALKGEVNPHIILTHARRDLHQDHRLINELTWNTFRNHFIMEYEIPKYDGDWATPNFFVPLEPGHVEAKIQALLTCYGSQRGRNWFTEDLFRSILRLRGMECNAPSGLAEAFYVHKALF